MVRSMETPLASLQRRIQVDPLSWFNENLPEMVRSMETPSASLHGKPKSGKTLKENGGSRGELQQNLSDVSVSQSTKSLTSFKLSKRPDTPTIGITTGGERVVSSRFRQAQRNNNNTVSAAVNLLQSSGMSMSSSQLPPTSDASKEALKDSSSSIAGSALDLLSSLQESDGSPKFPNRSSMYEASPCSWSMTFPSSRSHHAKPPTNLANSGSWSLHLTPLQGSKVGAEPKKTRKGSSHQEDVHNLRMLQNIYAAEVCECKCRGSMSAHKEEAEKTLYSAVAAIASKRDCLEQMHMEVERKKREVALSIILKGNDLVYLGNDREDTITQCMI